MDVGALLKMREVEVGRLLRILLAKGGMCQGGPPVEDTIAHRLGRVLHRRPTSQNPALSLQPTLQASAARRQAMLSRMVARRSGAARPDRTQNSGRRAYLKQQAVLALRKKRRAGLKRRFQSPCIRRRRIGRAIALRNGSKGNISWLPSHSYNCRRFHMKVLSLPSLSGTQKVSVPSHCVMRQASRAIRTFKNGGYLVSDRSALGVVSALPDRVSTQISGDYTQLLQSLEQHHAAKVVGGTSLLKVVDGWCVRITQAYIGTSGPVTVVGLSQPRVKVEGVAEEEDMGMSTWGVLLIAGPAGVLRQVARRGCAGFGLHSAALWDQPNSETIRRQCAMSTTPTVLCTSVGWVEELHTQEYDEHVDSVALHSLDSGVAGVQAGVLDVEIDGVPCWPGEGATSAVFRWRMCLGVLSPGGGLFTTPAIHSEESICEDTGPLGHDALQASLEVSRRAAFQRSRRAYGKAVGSGRPVGLTERGAILGSLGRPTEGDFAAIRWPSSISDTVRLQAPITSTNDSAMPVRRGKGSMGKLPHRHAPTHHPSPNGQLLYRLLLSGSAAFVMLSLNSSPIPAIDGQVARRVLSGASVGAPVHRVVGVTVGEKREREDEDVPPPPAVVGMVTSIIYNRLMGCYTAMALMPTPVGLDMPVTVGTSPSLVRGRIKAISK